MSEATLDIKIMKIHRIKEGGKLKAFVDLSVNDALIIKGIRVVDGREGLFMSMPSEQGKDEKWYERVRCLTKEVKVLMERTVLDAYHAEQDS